MPISDQRAHNRLNVDVPVTIVTANQDRVIGRCHDLSSHGIHLVSPRPAQIGEQWVVSLEATKRGIVDFVVTAEVSRCDNAADGGYVIGAQVLDIA
ncbi:PilZ domain-containing protein [Litorivicinus lipolyticus]|nr:PilZ domain-containing protein [Litorivicinus lipolyticus]